MCTGKMHILCATLYYRVPDTSEGEAALAKIVVDRRGREAS